MDFSASPSSRATRRTGRLLSGILLIAVITLGLGFYLPLRQSHQLLTARLETAQTSNDQLTTSLSRAETALKQVTAERDALAAFKDQAQSDTRRYSVLLEQNPAFKAASSKGIDWRPLPDGLSAEWTKATLVNDKRGSEARSSFTRSGLNLACSSVSEAKRSGLSVVTLRTFAIPSEQTSKKEEDPMTSAASVAAALADQLVRSCRVSASDVAIATSAASAGAPLLQLEFREPAPSAAAGL